MLLYRTLLFIVFPIVLGAFLLRVLRRQETVIDVLQRLGLGRGRRGAIWVHGASNGELMSAKSLIQALAQATPGHSIVVTCNTTTARDLVEDWGMHTVTTRLAPFDYRLNLTLFKRAWRPVILVVLENELWPNRLVTFQGPIFCIAGRMSEGSAHKWGNAAGLVRKILDRIEYLAPQNEPSGDRFVGLGLPQSALKPAIDLKASVELVEPDPREQAQLAKIFSRDHTILAASTHEGEEEVLFAAFAKARRMRPELRLIVAPRHTRRAAEIQELAEEIGLKVSRRSLGNAPKHEIYLADTMGEMALWYRLAAVTVVGGSLVDRGGHTPYEPAANGSAIVHGPFVSNFQHLYSRLDKERAAVQVSNPEELVTAWGHYADPLQRDAAVQSANAILWPTEKSRNDIDQVVAALIKTLSQSPSL